MGEVLQRPAKPTRLGSQHGICKRCFIFTLIGALVGMIYVGTSFRKDITVFFMNVVMTSQNQVFQGYGLSFVQRHDQFIIDSKTWQQTSIYEIFDKHKSRASENCSNTCDKDKDQGCAATNISSWKKLVGSPTFRFMPLLSEFQYIYPLDVDYMSHPPLTDQKKLPSLSLSKVYMDGAVGGKVFCTVGEVIKGRVDLVDGYGKQRTMGGDDVRVWIVDKQTKQYKAGGHVTDMRNGSYTISIRCLWPGQIQLNVAVAYPREYLRIVIHQMHRSITWYVAAKFKKQQIEEVTLCLPTPNIPGRPCLCNFTSVNQQSYYCGRPLDSRLSCNNFAQTHSLPHPQPRNVTPAEYKLIREIPRSKKTISHNLTITVSNTSQLPTLKPCSETSPSVTWDIDNKPSGYWTPGNKWTSLICQRPKITSNWTHSCLKNTSVWIFGDSNGVRLKVALWGLINKHEKLGAWNRKDVRQHKTSAIRFTFTPIEYPFYQGQTWKSRLYYGGVAKQIDKIPSTGAHVLVIHYYLHTAPYHLNIAFFRIKAAHDAIRKLIDRNPNVLVAFRGPHISSFDFDYNHSIGGDNLGIYLLEMIRYIFSDLRDKVIFLDGWEMTIALENPWSHPISAVPYEMISTLLAFKCS